MWEGGVNFGDQKVQNLKQYSWTRYAATCNCLKGYIRISLEKHNLHVGGGC